ncbi:MAG TPA: hypothetical protein VG649_22460, partial [Candidatus Angelobacter sp.]|nr:hypothetical protein [Candidatus Angelobacter sp.]
MPAFIELINIRTLPGLVLIPVMATIPLTLKAQDCPPLPSQPNNPFIRIPQPAITQINADTVKVRFDMPPVNRYCTALPQIKFREFDTVTINAGGCVQTGGGGKTWKRYVNPSGPNSDRLYHGLVSVPTATTGLERFQSAIERSPLSVRSIPPGVDPNSLILKLGYEDDDYGDNGYYDHDDGTEDQCRNVGNAFLELTITHHSQPSNPTISSFPMDLTWNEVDNNLLPLNPFWAFRTAHSNQLPDAGMLCNHFHDEGDILQLGS